jgi:hypothetical protein
VKRVCAWCGQELGAKDPEGGQQDRASEGQTGDAYPDSPESTPDSDVTGSICATCAGQLTACSKPVLVVSREWARLFEEIRDLFKSRPEIQVLLDRRRPTGVDDAGSKWNGPDRRRGIEPFGLK